MQRQLGHYYLVLVLALIGPLISCGGSSSPNVVLAQSTARTMAGLAGTWQATLVGNTGCGLTSYLVTFTLDSSGAATNAAITGHYLNGGNSVCVDGATSTGNSFNIMSLNSNGSGTAGLTCGAGCGWVFNIQVSRDSTVFNLVDVDTANFNNDLQGVAILQ